jgi:hypothetical protein
MTPAEKLQAAVGKLERLKAASTPGPLYAQNAGDVFTDLAAPNAEGVNAEQNDAWHVASFMSGQNDMPYREEEANRALFLTLHRTVDAQLTMMRSALEWLGEKNNAALAAGSEIFAGQLGPELEIATAILGVDE